MKNIDEYITKIYKFCRSFNLNISLRETLWKNGFFSNMNSLPGLVKQEYESLKTLTILKFKIIEKS